MKKNGFTLIELLGVIVILAIIITLATSTSISFLKKSDEKIREESRNNFKEAAISYVLEKKRLTKCRDSIINNIENYTTQTNSCFEKVLVETLKNEGLFEDRKGYCKNTDYVFVYRDEDGYKIARESKVCKE